MSATARLSAILLLTACSGCASLQTEIVWEGGTIPPGGAMTYSSMTEGGRWSARIEATRTVIDHQAVQVVLEGYGSQSGLEYHLRKDGSANFTLVLPGDRTVVWEGDVINVMGQVHDLARPGHYTFDLAGVLRYEEPAAGGG